MSYDFTTLSPEDFESLVADLLSREFGAQLEVFKRGRDGGVDLRHSRVLRGQRPAIVQCKRYVSYRFSALVGSMQKELPKLSKLKPERYLVATSVELSPANKDELVRLLTPWCHGPEDIYGAAELLALIRKYPEIERAHFKLWISSTAVLERILQSRIFNLTEDTVESAKEQLSRLVVHDGFRRALNVLAEHRHVLIVGNPGIGKTTLARMLMCHYLQEGFEPIVVAGDIGDVWAAMQANKDNDRKIVVLYDDFLGQLRFDAVRFGKNEEISLHAFLEKVRRSNRFRFILTTREYILADARRVHGAFAADAEVMARCTVSLNDYTPTHRAKVLFNHLYFSALPESRLQKLVEQRVYRRIIAHRHFSPRIVEGISNFANSKSMSDEEYLAYIEREFDDPRGVWEHPFRHQISPTARQLLVLLWSFGGPAELGELKAALLRLNAARPAEEVSLQGHDALRELDGNFLSTNRYPLNRDPARSVTVVDFQNPSVKEFVEGFVRSEQVWLERLATAVVTFAQIEHLTPYGVRAPEAFWSQLDEAARRLESQPTGHLVNYVRYPRAPSVREWRDFGRPIAADRMVGRLEIAERMQSGAFPRRELLQRLTATEGWRVLLADAGYDDDVARGVKRLLEWFEEERSGITSADKQAVGAAFRSYLYEALLLPTPPWEISVTGLLELASAFVLFDTNLDEDQREAFVKAAIDAAERAPENYSDPESLESEALAIKKIGKLFGTRLEVEHDVLMEAAEEARKDQPPDDDTRESYREYASDRRDEGVDVDALFAGLLDR